MDILKMFNAVLGFCLEMGMYSAYAMWAYSITTNSALKWIGAVLLPVCIAIVWGIFASPNPAVHLAPTAVYCIQIALFLIAAGLLYALGKTSWAIIFAILSIGSTIIAIVTQQ